MDEADRFHHFLDTKGLKALSNYGKSFTRQLIKNSPATEVKVACSRTFEVDEDNDQLVIKDQIEFRLGHAKPDTAKSATIYPFRDTVD